MSEHVALKNTEILSRAQEILEHQGTAESRAYLDEWDKRRPDSTISHMLAELDVRDGDRSTAIARLLRRVDSKPDAFFSRLLLAQLLEEAGDQDGAVEQYRLCLKSSPRRKDVTEALSRLLPGEPVATSDVKTPLTEIEKSLERDDFETALPYIAELQSHQDELAQLPWPDDPILARAAHFAFSLDPREALASYRPALIDMSVEYGYLTWPWRIQQYVKHKTVLDVGCGFGGYGVGYLAAGARSYTGLDPSMDLDSTRARDKRMRQWRTMPMTSREIMADIDAIELFQGKSEDLPLGGVFDAVTLHNVTEHLMALDEVFAGLVDVMHEGSVLVYLHHHFYNWNGHHRRPANLDQLNLSDPKQNLFADWNHVINSSRFPEDHYIHTHLNQISLAELRRITEKYFAIQTWVEIESPPDILARLSDEIVAAALAAHPAIVDRDLRVNRVFCVAKLR